MKNNKTKLIQINPMDIIIIIILALVIKYIQPAPTETALLLYKILLILFTLICILLILKGLLVILHTALIQYYKTIEK